MRRIIAISSFILLIATQSQAQTAGRNTTPPVVTDKIVKTYPNPATDRITFEFQKDDKGLTIQIYSFVGRKMYENLNPQQKTTINLTDYNRGLYMYHIIDARGTVIDSGKFQVTK